MRMRVKKEKVSLDFVCDEVTVKELSSFRIKWASAKFNIVGGRLQNILSRRVCWILVAIS